MSHESSDDKLALDLTAQDFPLDRYEPLEKLGTGSSGVVYLALDKRLNKKVAVKTLHLLDAPQLIQFQEEARTNSKLTHPNIVDILDFGATEAGAPYMVLELFDGINLAHYLENKGVLEPDTCIEITIQLARALCHAHRSGIFHRDLKPSNILLHDNDDGYPLVKLIDFGVAKVRELTGNVTEYQGRTLAGTPFYMSPDVVMGKAYTKASEVYSLGCVVYEMMAGKPPFLGETALEVLSQHSKVEAPELVQVNADVPDELSRIVSKCLLKDSSKRYQSMDELLMALESYSTEITVEESLSEGKTTRLRAFPVLFLGLAIALVCGLISWNFMSSGEQDSLENIKLSDTFKPRPERESVFIGALAPSEELSVKKLSDDHYSVQGKIARGDLKRLFSKVDKIGYLTLKRNVIYGDDLISLISRRPREMDLSFCIFTEDSMEAIAEFKDLEILRLEGVKFYDIDNLKKLERLPKLKFLSLADTTFSDSDLKQIKRFKKLKFLDVRDCTELSQKALLELANFDGLDGIAVSAEHRDSKFFQSIQNLPVVHLYDFSDREVPFVSGLNASHLLLHGDGFTSSGLEALGRMVKLRDLAIHSRQISDDAIARFKRLNPKCVVRSLIRYE